MMMVYNSDLEQHLFNSLTVGETAAHQPKRSVRFQDTPKSERPQKKKLARDSQKQRESVGSPGSRKYNRHRNQMELLDRALSDSENELEIEIEFFVEFKSPFRILFENEEVKERWEPFIEITEEEQTRILSFYPSLVRPPPVHTPRSGFPTAPQDCFKLLRKEERKLLRNNACNPIIAKFEDIIIDLILSRRTSKTLKFSRYECLLFGLTCVYYSVEASAEALPDGDAGVTVRKPKGVQLPSVKLSEYLKTLQTDS